MFLRNPPNVPACIKNYAFAFSLVEIGFMFLLTFLAGRKKCVLLPVPSSAGSDASPSFLSRKKMNSVHFPSFISSDGGLYRLHVCRKGFSILCRSIITIEEIAMDSVRLESNQLTKNKAGKGLICSINETKNPVIVIEQQ